MSPRLAPRPREDWDDEAREALRRGFGSAAADALGSTGAGAPPVPTVLGTLLHHPRLAGPFLAYNSVLLQQPTIDPRRRELMILRVAWRTGAPYEWVQHVRLALGVGVMREEIEALAGDGVGDRWSPLERDLLAATDQMLDGYRVDDATWERLAGALRPDQLVEVVFVVGTYAALAMAFNSFGLELDPELHELAATVPMPEPRS